MAFVSYLSLIYSLGTYKTSTRKKFGPMKIPTRKNLDPQYTHEKKLGTNEGTVARWQDAYETHNGTRSTEFSTLIFKVLN